MRPIEREQIAENEAGVDAAMEVAGLAQAEVDTLKETGEQYLPFTDGTTNIRVGVRATKFVVDKTLTATGFAGIENTDWTNIVLLPA